MAQCLSKLESLLQDFVYDDVFNGVRFPNLKILEIQYLNDRIDWNITKSHTQLTELTIEKIYNESNIRPYLNSSDIYKITSNVSLQSLRLGVGFVAHKQFSKSFGKSVLS